MNLISPVGSEVGFHRGVSKTRKKPKYKPKEKKNRREIASFCKSVQLERLPAGVCSSQLFLSNIFSLVDSSQWVVVGGRGIAAGQKIDVRDFAGGSPEVLGYGVLSASARRPVLISRHRSAGPSRSRTGAITVFTRRPADPPRALVALPGYFCAPLAPVGQL